MAEVLAEPTPFAREFVTFVNPSLQKGASFFARLADVLGSRRPDIPILVLESAMDGRVLAGFSEVNLAKYPQIKIGPPALRRLFRGAVDRIQSSFKIRTEGEHR